MSNLKNRVQLIGNLGNDPEVITFDSGKKLVKASLATNEKYKNASGQDITDTDWHNVVAWGKTADLFEKFLSKGDQCGVVGKLKNRSYQGEDGETKYVTEVVVDELLLMGK